mgnify:CR=1 FL=1
MNIQITLSDESAAGWQSHLDSVVNPQRDQANLMPHTLQTFFQEAEETGGVQHFNLKAKRDKYEAMKVREGLSDKDLFMLSSRQCARH